MRWELAKCQLKNRPLAENVNHVVKNVNYHFFPKEKERKITELEHFINKTIAEKIATNTDDFHREKGGSLPLKQEGLTITEKFRHLWSKVSQKPTVHKITLGPM